MQMSRVATKCKFEGYRSGDGLWPNGFRSWVTKESREYSPTAILSDKVRMNT